MRADDAFLGYYLRELGALRDAGAAFAEAYPHVAAGLDISDRTGADPQIDRLIESFAFLTAKLEQQYDARFPEAPMALLEAMYPQLVAPVPSVTIAEFEVDSGQAKALEGVEVPKGTPLYATAEDSAGVECRFRTGYPLRLWPLKVAAVTKARSADLSARAAQALLEGRSRVELCLSVSLECVGPKARFGDLPLTSLCFYIDGDKATRARLYELLCNKLEGVAVLTPGDAPGGETFTRLPGVRVRPMGLDPEEALLPYPDTAHAGYRLIQEYFAFPDKFMFFEVTGLAPGALGAGREAQLIFLLQDGHADDLRVHAHTLRLGCVPIINLFHRTSEPIRLDHLSVEYPLSPDLRYATTTEVHTVLGVSRSAAAGGGEDLLQPFFSATPDLDGGRSAASGRWLARRRRASNPALSGSEVMLSFVDPHMRPDKPAADVVFAHLLCTNRALARQLSPRTRLTLELDLPLRAIRCLQKPTAPVDATFTGEHMWRLVSQLTLNKLSLDGETGRRALQQILSLYAGVTDRADNLKQIESLTGLSTRREVGCYGEKQWRGFVRGTEVTMVFNDKGSVGGSAFLLASVLERFIALYAGINSFTRLVIKRDGQNDVWRRWPARAGDRLLL